MATYSDLITGAFTEIRSARAGDVVNPDDLDLGLTCLNDLFDEWNADDQLPYMVAFTNFTITPSLQPHTIGLAGNTPVPTWSVTGNRPTRILGANLIFTNVTPNVYKTLNIVTDQWWLNQSVPGQTSPFPTDLFYSDDFPNGSVYLWPVPTTAYGIRVQYQALFADVAIGDTITLPPGYRKAIKLTLAENLADAMGREVSPRLAARASKARARIIVLNTDVPTLDTRDAGSSGSGHFDYRTGVIR